MISFLPEDERKVLSLRYGFADGRMRSLSETAAALGFSREQVRVLEVRALRRLRWSPISLN
jgi:DNA-directed RNA polymerase sigma subunit (sigma70/sigma32)